MEYMEHGALLKMNGKMTYEPIQDLQTIRKYLRDIILGLDYLHSKRVIHGDIKPENLLVGPDFVVRIADFGVSYILESDNPFVTKALGTPAFTAPECENKCFLAFPLDIWALGVTLVMMITGICPFAGDTIQDTFEKIQIHTPVIPPDLPTNLKHLITALLTKDPSQRIIMSQLKEHPWVTRNGEESLRQPYETITDNTTQKECDSTKFSQVEIISMNEDNADLNPS
ncbi:hypothetical protein RFI_31771 [Reticulomyxa filosa]|uniref:Protein kinase domain-containing protein n=1 Tax=Reticulomyxa filosa TaxID=46433 RepID=X6LWV0_RETFI|nr:hypothetical protein RFI_31771 [Reticulomyxa filosa]|eukprot:ETO05627.1 hypothetical protein RFI_31771 [Reticulomyxa filosa]